MLPQNDTRRHKTPPPPRPPGPEASRPTSTPLLLRRLAEGTCMGVGAPPYSSELSRRPARRRIRQGVVQSDPNITGGISYLLTSTSSNQHCAERHRGHVEVHPGPHPPLTCRPIAQPHPRPRHDLARHLRRLHHPLSTCCLASRWKEDMAFLRSFYVADDIWRFA